VGGPGGDDRTAFVPAVKDVELENTIILCSFFAVR
jgi:hypothetical protein